VGRRVLVEDFEELRVGMEIVYTMCMWCGADHQQRIVSITLPHPEQASRPGVFGSIEPELIEAGRVFRIVDVDDDLPVRRGGLT
jgi:hypothetical protein